MRKGDVPDQGRCRRAPCAPRRSAGDGRRWDVPHGVDAERGEDGETREEGQARKRELTNSSGSKQICLTTS